MFHAIKKCPGRGSNDVVIPLMTFSPPELGFWFWLQCRQWIDEWNFKSSLWMYIIASGLMKSHGQGRNIVLCDLISICFLLSLSNVLILQSQNDRIYNVAVNICWRKSDANFLWVQMSDGSLIFCKTKCKWVWVIGIESEEDSGEFWKVLLFERR